MSATKRKADQTPARRIETARARLRRAVDVACIARGEAQYTAGYRCGTQSVESALWAKEQAQWKGCAVAERRVERAITALIRAVRG
jgi:hypothetical protein